MEQEIKAQVEHIKSILTPPNAKELLGYIDLTTLNATDSPAHIENFCIKVNQFLAERPEASIPAVCVYPNYVEQCKAQLNEQIKVACVTTGFPDGQTFTAIKKQETELAVQAGADEIDCVLNRGLFLSGNVLDAKAELIEIKQACRNAKLKVILEVCDFPGATEVMEATKLAIEAGADFVKTSTGKGAHGATPDSFYAMCLAVKDHEESTGKKIGLKAAGGIRTLSDAWLYRSILVSVLGDSWLNPNLFRIGASSLAAALEEAIFPAEKGIL